MREALAKGPLANRADVAKVYGELLKRVYYESKSAAAAGVASPPPVDPVRQQLLKLLVGREAPGGNAIALIEVDGDVPASVLAEVQALPQVQQAKPLKF